MMMCKTGLPTRTTNAMPGMLVKEKSFKFVTVGLTQKVIYAPGIVVDDSGAHERVH